MRSLFNGSKLIQYKNIKSTLKGIIYKLNGLKQIEEGHQMMYMTQLKIRKTKLKINKLKKQKK